LTNSSGRVQFTGLGFSKSGNILSG